MPRVPACDLIAAAMSIGNQKEDRGLPRQILRPTTISFNSNQLKTDQQRSNVKFGKKNDDIRFKGSDVVVQNVS